MRLTDVDLVAVIGISTSIAQTILFEVGRDMSLLSRHPVGGAIALGLRGLLAFYKQPIFLLSMLCPAHASSFPDYSLNLEKPRPVSGMRPCLPTPYRLSLSPE